MARARIAVWARAGARVVGATVLALLVCVAALYVLACHTAPGREQLRALAVAKGNELLRGRIAVRELARIGVTGIALRGVEVHDPKGVRVLSVETLAIELAPRELVSGAIAIDRIAIAGASVDLGESGAANDLRAAFALRAPSEPPETTAKGEPPRIIVRAIELDRIAIGASVPDLGRIDVTDLSLRASFALDGTARAELRALRAALARDGSPLGTIASANAVWTQRGAPSRVALRAQLGSTQLALDASGRMPDDPEFGASPLSLALTCAPIDPALLQALGQAQLASQLRTPLHIELTASGTADALDAELALTSSAGNARLRARLRERTRLELALRSDGVTPSALWLGAPEQRVALALDGKLGVEDAPRVIPFELQLSNATLDGDALPELQASGRVEGESVRDLKLEARGHGASLTVTGELAADRLELRGGLHARGFAVAGASAQTLDATFSAQGPPSALAVALELRGGGLGHGELGLTELALRVRGGPTRYALALDATVPEGKLPGGTLALTADVVRGERSVQLDAAARGVLRRYPFVLRVRQARFGFDGAIAVEQAIVEAFGQRVEASGSYGRAARDRLTLHAHADLPALSRGLALDAALLGTADLTLVARGTTARPTAELTLRAHGIGLPDRPRFDAEASATLDAAAGVLSGKTRVTSARDLELAVALAARFAARGAPWHEALRTAQVDATLAVAELRSEWVEKWLPEPLPVRAALRAEAALRGTLDRPELTAKVDAQVRHPEQKRALAVALTAGYAAEAAELTLAVTDARGAFIDGRFDIAHRAGGVREFLAPGTALADVAEWNVALRVAPRTLGELAAGLPLAPHLAVVSFGLELTASHAPGTEPTAQLSLNVSRPAQAKDPDTTCAEQGLEIDLRAGLARGRADLHATAQSDAQRLFELRGGAEVALSPALAGTGAPRASDAAVTVQLAQLDLATLPIVCGLARGQLSGTITAKSLLAAAPELDVELEGRQLGLGAKQTMDLSLRARARDPEATLQAELRHARTRSTLVARLPIRWRGRTFEPIEDRPLSAHVTLDRLPIAALLPPSFAVSHASGHLSGDVVASGTLQAPRVRGQLTPQAIALTATALAQPLHGIDGRIAFTDRTLTIEKLVAHDADGTISLRGKAELDDQKRIAAKFEVTADEFPLRQQGQIAGELDAHIALQAKVTEEETRVQVVVADASAWVLGGEQRKGISLQPHPDIVDPRARRAAEETAEPPGRPFVLTLDANDSFWVRRDDFAVKLSTRLQIDVRKGAVRVLGPLQIHRGYLQLFGETFEIDGKSKVEFTGGDPPDPVLDITAVTTNRRSGERIGVKISGLGSAPVLAFSIDEREVTAGDAALAMFGSRGGGDDAEGQAKSFVAGMLAGVMAVSARRELGAAMPILMLEPEDDLASTRVRAGFELDDLVPNFLAGAIRGVYVEGIVAGGGDESGAGGNSGSSAQGGVQGGVLLELYLPHSFLTSGQYGPGETWSVDVGWEP